MRHRHLAVLVVAATMLPTAAAARADTYLEQLGITYPTVRREPTLGQQ